MRYAAAFSWQGTWPQAHSCSRFVHDHPLKRITQLQGRPQSSLFVVAPLTRTRILTCVVKTLKVQASFSVDVENLQWLTSCAGALRNHAASLPRRQPAFTSAELVTVPLSAPRRTACASPPML
ncbi:hypothetical protein LY78DRAFT_325834 [Colletotrichum sublineola]|nr:hypothetical protein LY78DRAFT_325834 [Colletotrichum sublineola]